jgi:DNA-binding NarL/FixJ family response regulator
MSRPTNALIIDDEAHVRMLLTALLKQLGVKTVWVAGDGAAGLEQAAQQKPEFVLLDLNLPEVSGFEVLGKLKTDYPKLPVVVVSAQSTVRTITRVKEMGADGYVLKYAQKSEVMQMISDALDRAAAMRSEMAAEAVEKRPESG